MGTRGRFTLADSVKAVDPSVLTACLKASLASTAILYLFSILFEPRMVGGRFLAVFLATSTALSIAGRVALRCLLGWLRVRGRGLRHLLIVGTNRRAVAFARKIEQTPRLGCRVIGFVDDCDWDTRREFATTGYPLLSDLAGLPDLLRHQVIDEVVVLLPIKSCYQISLGIVSLCEEQGILVEFPASPFEVKQAYATTEVTERHPLIAVDTGAMSGWPLLVKRVLDVVVASALIVALAPLFLVLAALVKLTSPGPVFFVQERLGLHKRRFRMVKFRTMVADAEQMVAAFEHLNDASGPVFKMRNDPRVTPLGAILRKTSMDELPQLWNVIKGDLSLVGPRPLPVRDYEGFDRDWHRRRFSVRPGITCLWQIGGRSNVGFERWMDLDVQYIDTWTLWLDIKILLKTIPAVLRRTGAV
jgi:exopolysaccharide biosynthesis polyprenyl glycosylphosphotransferase